MQLGRRARAALAGLMALAPLAGVAAGDVIQGRVVGIADGDSITVVDDAKVSHRLELHGIDAPELGQEFGNKSKANLSRLASGKPVRAECVKRARSELKFCTVWTHPADCVACGFTLDLGLMQVLQGYAWHFKQSEVEQSPEKQAQYSVAEVEARSKKVGLWAAGQTPVAPWDWRKAAKAR